MKRKSPKVPLPKVDSPNLNVSRLEAEQLIQRQIDKGIALCDRNITSKQELETLFQDQERWDDFNTETLKRVFTNDVLAASYNNFIGGSYPMNAGWQWWAKDLKAKLSDKINRLTSIKERLSLFDEPTEKLNTHLAAPAIGRDVFVVHGRDNAKKEAVARFLEKLKLNPIILHEQPNAGKTIIEKFEDQANVGYAIILLTPDDEGRIQDEHSSLAPRARQNVIFELGYFFGRLSRQRVCALYTPTVELPTDINGVLYIPLADESWRLLLAKELRHAGFDINMNDLL